MDVVAPLLRMVFKPLAAYLNQPCADYAPVVESRIDLLARVLVPGDVILVAGNTRFASLVRLLTQSTWSHVAMFVGPLEQAPDPPCIVEADVEQGVRTIRLSELRGMTSRVLRATGLAARERSGVARRVLARVGQRYDVDCALELMCSLWSVRRRDAWLRRDPAPRASADRAICSTLLAHAFEEADYPILPGDAHRAAIASGAPSESRVYTPRDFDLSPSFAVVSTAEPPHPATPPPSAVVAPALRTPPVHGSRCG